MKNVLDLFHDLGELIEGGDADTIGALARLIRRIVVRRRTEDRAALLAELEKAAIATHAKFDEADRILHERFPGTTHVPAPAQAGDKTEPGDAS